MELTQPFQYISLSGPNFLILLKRLSLFAHTYICIHRSWFARATPSHGRASSLGQLYGLYGLAEDVKARNL